jgi:outer membrane protein assembly factor BamB
MRWRWTAVVVATMLLGGCDTWFGESEKPPLPGERISVLEHQRGLAADPQAHAQAVVLPPPVVNSAWPQAGGDPSHAMHNLQAGAIGRPAWQVDIGAGVADDRPVLASPVVAGDRVFTIDTEHVVSAFDAGTGKRIWRVDLAENEDDDDAAPGGIAYAEGRIFVATGFGRVVALDAGDGKRVWRRGIGLPIHVAPTVSDGRVYVVTVENQLRALRASDGSDAWPQHQALAEIARLVGGGSPAVDGGVVVAPFSSGELAALRTDNGRPLWVESLAPARRTDELSSLAQIRARPIIDQGRVYAISVGGILAAFDLRTGQRFWDRDIGGLQSPWIAGRQIYLITNDGQLICVAADTGFIHWVRPLPAFVDEEEHKGPILWSGPVLTGDRLLLVGTNGKLLAVSPGDGTIIETRDLADRFSVAPIIAGGTVYLLDDDGELSAYR